jgi:hypothetical protein
LRELNRGPLPDTDKKEARPTPRKPGSPTPERARKPNPRKSNIPTTNGSLGQWVKKQRILCRSKELKKDRYEKLVGIGFLFEDVKFANENEKWNTRFMELVKYKQKNGHCNFPTKNGSFGEWISTQRSLFRSKKLKADRYEKLAGVGFA